MISRTKDRVKRAVCETAFRPFIDGHEIENVPEYRLMGYENLYIMISVKTEFGPRYFTIKVTENY